MGLYSYFKVNCIFVLLMLPLACGGGDGGGGSAPASAPNISTSESSLGVGGVVINSSADKSVEITNVGNANLIIGQISNPSLPFSIVADACSNATLTISQSCLVSIRFAPLNQGSFTSTFSIPSNDPDSNVVNISLTGDGYGLNVWINKVDSSQCPSISLDVTVTDPKNPGILLNSLTKDNFKVYQNGEQVQDITATAIEYPSPVSAVLSIDFSDSEQGVLDTITAAANSFIDQLTDEDYGAVSKFNSTIGFYPEAGTGALFISADSSGRSLLKSYIAESFPQTGATLLFTAVLQSIDRAAQGTTEKRAVIVLSDGIADGDNVVLNQVIADAVQKGIPVFTIYYTDPNYQRYTSEEKENGLLNMVRLAEESGGQYYNGLTTNLADVFREIGNVLSSKYNLTYTSSICSGTITLDVKADWNNGSNYLNGEDSRTIALP
jgi:VWFA-related protein